MNLNRELKRLQAIPAGCRTDNEKFLIMQLLIRRADYRRKAILETAIGAVFGALITVLILTQWADVLVCQ